MKNIMIINKHIVVMPEYFHGTVKIYGLFCSMQARRIENTIRILDVKFSTYYEFMMMLNVLCIYSDMVRIPKIQLIEKALCGKTEEFLLNYGFHYHEMCGDDIFTIMDFDVFYRY